MQTENNVILEENAMMGPFPTMDFLRKELEYVDGSRVCLAQVTNSKDLENTEKALKAKEFEILMSMKTRLVKVIEFYKTQTFNHIDHMSAGVEKELEFVNARLAKFKREPVEFEMYLPKRVKNKFGSINDLIVRIKIRSFLNRIRK